MKIIPIFINQRGCPFKCIYCQQSDLWEKTAGLSAYEAEDFLNCAVNKLPTSQKVEVAFYGGTFTGMPIAEQTLYLKAAHQAKKTGHDLGIRISTRPDLLDEEAIRLLKEHEVGTIELGVQSLDDEVLRNSKRGYTSQVVKCAVRRLRRAGFKVGIQLMCGLPGDTVEKHCHTLREVVSLNPDMVRLYPTLVFAGTPLATLYEQGKYQPLSLESAVEWGVIAKDLLHAHDIPLIRMGLHLSLTDELAKVIIAGPAHSAYGQMVKSRWLRKRIEKVLQKFPLQMGSDVEFKVPQRTISDFLGVKKEEFKYLVKHYPGINLSYSVNPASDVISISNGEVNHLLRVA